MKTTDTEHIKPTVSYSENSTFEPFVKLCKLYSFFKDFLESQD